MDWCATSSIQSPRTKLKSVWMLLCYNTLNYCAKVYPNAKDPFLSEDISVMCAICHNITYPQQMTVHSITLLDSYLTKKIIRLVQEKYKSLGEVYKSRFCWGLRSENASNLRQTLYASLGAFLWLQNPIV